MALGTAQSTGWGSAAGTGRIAKLDVLFALYPNVRKQGDKHLAASAESKHHMRTAKQSTALQA